MRYILISLLITGVIVSTNAFRGPMAIPNRLAFEQFQKSLTNMRKSSKPTPTSTVIPTPDNPILINNSNINYGISIVHTIYIGIMTIIIFMFWNTM